MPSDDDHDAPAAGPDDWRHAVHDAAVAAERETGAREATVAAAERHILWRLTRAALGFVLIGVGIALVPLPGPGWLVIVAGLTMLPFVWAERTVRRLRRRIPGVPDEGRIPTRTAIVGIAAITVPTILMVLFGAELTRWAAEAFGDPDRILG